MIITFDKTNQNRVFYGYMGEYFANRKYANEMGGWQFYNTDNSIWFVYIDEQENVNGFCSAIINKTHIYYDNMYVLEKFRRNSISKELFKSRQYYCETHYKKMQIRCIIDNMNTHHQKTVESNGFVYYGDRGKYKKYRYDYENRN